jgi:hypothetical protein
MSNNKSSSQEQQQPWAQCIDFVIPDTACFTAIKAKPRVVLGQDDPTKLSDLHNQGSHKIIGQHFAKQSHHNLHHLGGCDQQHIGRGAVLTLYRWRPWR